MREEGILGQIIEIPFSYNLIEFLVERVFEVGRKDFSQTWIVFPHRRPIDYFSSSFAHKIKSAFFPPQLFSIEDFISFLTQRISSDFKSISPAEGAYLLFQILKEIPRSPWTLPSVSFAQFLPWGIKLHQIIEEVEMALITSQQLKNIEMKEIWPDYLSRKAGFIIDHLSQIKEAYSQCLAQRKLMTRSRQYVLLAQNIGQLEIEGKRIYFAGLFALTEVEKKIIRTLMEKKEVIFIRQSQPEQSWEPFEEMDTWPEVKEVRRFKKAPSTVSSPSIFLHQGQTLLAEIIELRNVLAESNLTNRAPAKTALILSAQEELIPLLSEVMTVFPVEYNVTLSYPLVRTPVYALLEILAKLHERQKKGVFYLEDYLNFLGHPYIKNISDQLNSASTRILVHSIEEVLLSERRTLVDPKEIEENSDFFKPAIRMSEGKISLAAFQDFLRKLHFLFLKKPEEIVTLNQLIFYFEEILTYLLRHSPAAHYPFSDEFFHAFFVFFDRVKEFLFKEEKLNSLREVFDLFRSLISLERMPFHGLPLRGWQIMGLLESRCLQFDEVFILDVNEGVLPPREVPDSLLPLSLRKILKLPTPEQVEEIFRYHFLHLVQGAKKVHLFFREDEKNERSRFIEQLVWEEEKKQRKVDVLRSKIATFDVFFPPLKKFEISKNQEILEQLRRFTFSVSSLDLYLNCPAKFYFSALLKLKEREKIKGEVENSTIGNIFHRTLKELYSPFCGEVLDEEKYEIIRGKLRKVLEENCQQCFHSPLLQGEAYLIKEMAYLFLRDYLISEEERRRGEVKVMATEETLTHFAEIEGIGKVCFTGRIDRVDLIEEEHIIIDYKVSKELNRYFTPPFSSVLTSREEMKEQIKSFQLPFYLWLYWRKKRQVGEGLAGINGKLISLLNQQEKVFFKNKNWEEFLGDIFWPTIVNLTKEIFNPKVPFRSDPQEGICAFCSFSPFCEEREEISF